MVDPYLFRHEVFAEAVSAAFQQLVAGRICTVGVVPERLAMETRARRL
jgi:mannose-1-phosphate guanylyltransferase